MELMSNKCQDQRTPNFMVGLRPVEASTACLRGTPYETSVRVSKTGTEESAKISLLTSMIQHVINKREILFPGFALQLA